MLVWKLTVDYIRLFTVEKSLKLNVEHGTHCKLHTGTVQWHVQSKENQQIQYLNSSKKLPKMKETWRRLSLSINGIFWMFQCSKIQLMCEN